MNQQKEKKNRTGSTFSRKNEQSFHRNEVVMSQYCGSFLHKGLSTHFCALTQGTFKKCKCSIFQPVWKEFKDKTLVISVPHLAWADFKIKVKQIAHSTLRFDQWNPLISKMKIFTGLFFYSDQHAFWNFIENKNDKKSIIENHKN